MPSYLLIQHRPHQQSWGERKRYFLPRKNCQDCFFWLWYLRVDVRFFIHLSGGRERAGETQPRGARSLTVSVLAGERETGSLCLSLFLGTFPAGALPMQLDNESVTKWALRLLLGHSLGQQETEVCFLVDTMQEGFDLDSPTCSCLFWGRTPSHNFVLPVVSVCVFCFYFLKHWFKKEEVKKKKNTAKILFNYC